MPNKYAVADKRGNWLTGAGDASAGAWHYDISQAWPFDTMQEALPWVQMFPEATMHLIELRIVHICEVK